MSEARKLLVIIDPTHDVQIALERALSKSKLLEIKPEICLLICVDAGSANLKADNKNVYRDGAWLKGITHDLDAEGIKYSFIHCWSSQWHQAVIHVARQFHPNNILIPDYRDDEKIFELSNEKWALFRSSAAAVTLVRPGHGAPLKKILAAVNIQKDSDPKYAKLIDKVLEESGDIAAHYGAELHVVNSYMHISDHPTMENVIQRTNLPAERIHIPEGSPDNAIADCARKLEVDMVVIGTLARDGALAFLKGNTSEKILRKVEQDVVVLS